MNRRDFIKNALTVAALMPLTKLDAGSTFVRKSSGNISADLLFTNVELYDGTGSAPSGVEAVYVNGRLAYSPDSDAKTFRAGKVLRIK